MDSTSVKRWRELHLRVASGDRLSTEEEREYRAGLRELEQGDPIGGATLAKLQQLRQNAAALEAERAELLEKTRQLDARIATLEAALRQRTGEIVGKED